MFFRLVFYELRYYFKNAAFYLIMLLSLLFVISQAGNTGEYPREPKPEDGLKTNAIGLSPYGYKKMTDPQKIMNAVYLQHLSRSTAQKEVTKNYFFINKTEKLDEAQVGYIQAAMDMIAPEGGQTGGTVEVKVSYEEFWQILDKLDMQLGGHTEYGHRRLENSLFEPKTYEEALKSYKALTVDERYTRAVARLAADYLGIVLGILPVFLGIFIFYRDRRCKSEELIFSRKGGGVLYVGAKFTGLCTALSAAVLAAAAYFTLQAAVMGANGYAVDVWAYLRTFILWLLPTAMAVSALAMLVSLLFRSYVPGIITGFIWWAVSISPLEGNYGLYKLFIRHNSLEGLTAAASSAVLANRAFIAFVALCLLLITSMIWEKRRERYN